MQISARSYLMSGVSLTAATAIALTPLVVPAKSQDTVAILNVTVSDIQLAVTPEEVVSFFRELDQQLLILNTAVAMLAGIPGAAVILALELATELNDGLYDALRESTNNPTLLTLFNILQDSVDTGLTSLVDALVNVNALVATGRDIADLVTGTLTGSLSNVLSAVVAVANDPMNFANYIGLLGAGVATGELIADNGLEIVQNLGNAGFVLVDTGITLAQDQINNAIQTVRNLIDLGAGIPGSELISAVVAAAQEIVIGPAQAALDISFGAAADVLVGFQRGFSTVIDNVQDLVTSTSTNLQTGLGAIGANPLDPTSYLIASALVAASGFDAFNTTVGTIGSVAQIPFSVASSVTEDTAEVIVGQTQALAEAFAGVLDALGLPEDTANLPYAIAEAVETVISGGAGLVVEGLDVASGAIGASTAVVIGVSNAVEDALLGPLQPSANPSPAQAVPSFEKTALEASGGPSGGPVPLTEDSDGPAAEDQGAGDETSSAAEGQSADGQTADDETTGEQTTDEQTTGEQTTDEQTTGEQTTDDQTTDEQTTDDETTGVDDATAEQGTGSEGTESGADAAGENGRYTANSSERDAQKAERQSEDADSDSNSRSDASSASDSE
ncbi:hypothetical protein [Mycolicibacterium mengxianglii]|uniref:hypothetical protein n=1 Tax=Mycolicibacterium mengxianglii TaxID=2736649 RepID=UPI0018D1BA8D|nr:hypothetical protein [Mycolicibacterium mengxianglii]